MFVGVSFPLKKSGKNVGFDSFTEDEISEAVKFNIKNIILTFPGERIWDTSFGVGIKRILFEQNVVSVLDQYKSIIIGQLESYASYINVEFLDLFEIGEATIKIILQYSINKTDIIDTLEIEINSDLI
jgi:phage baseplate assembly protein W